MDRRDDPSLLRSLRHRCPRNRGNMAAAQAAAFPDGRAKNNTISPFTSHAASVPDLRGSPPGKFKAGAASRKLKTGRSDGDTRVHQNRIRHVQRSFSASRTARSHTRSTAATTVIFRRPRRRKVAATSHRDAIRARACAVAPTADDARRNPAAVPGRRADGRWYTGRRRRSHRRARERSAIER